MVNRKKKKGSSILITVGMFAMLSILIMSVLAMTTSGYSMRIKSNKRIENFYGADSGIEICQKLIYDYLTEAIIFGNQEVDKNNNFTIKEKNEFFKDSFKKFIEKGGEIQDVKDEVGNIIYKGKNRTGIVDYVTTQSHYDSLGRNKVKIEGFLNPLITNRSNEEYKLDIKSTFNKEDKERIISVEFYLKIPDYGKELVKATSKGTPNIMNYIIGVDGDFTIETEGTAHIIGDMWVKGKKPSGEITKDNKYEGGIKILSPNTSNANVKWLGKIVTNETLTVENAYLQVSDDSKLENVNKNKVKNKLKENIYARNFVYNYDSLNNFIAKESIGLNTDLYIYNDFVINGKMNNIKIGNYYGLNDISNYKGNNDSEAEKSSSIIVNSKDYGKDSGSSLYVDKDAYILGTSYIDLGAQSYQTGQSNIINQISKPYTFRFDDKEYIYDYKGNLHLANKKQDENGIESELDLNDKMEIIREYYKVMEEEAKEISKGTNIKGNIYSAGAVMANGGIKEHKAPDNTMVNKLQQEYSKEVFNMGMEGNYNEYDFWRGEPKSSVSESFDWKFIDKIASNPEEYDSIKVISNKSDEEDSFIHVVPKLKNSDGIWNEVTVDKIMGVAYENKEHPLAMYGYVAGGEIGSTNPNIILNGTNKKLKIISKKSGTSGIDEKLTTKDTLVYNLVEENENLVTPLLVISQGDILYENFEGKKYAMLLTAGEARVNVSNNPGNLVFGNYHTAAMGPSIDGHQVGERKFINELYKYIFETDDIMGEVGNGIFEGTETKETIHAIEVSDLLKKKNWKLEK